ncbi:hypothetical protein GCM10009681_27010 [Luedemannella helvata]|uniref:Pyrrolo-quinoline quinone repeat domain-containing protein n=1 Tax=Luedemannella helvata TaxID=349315 RepID=A0ABN2KEV0_9ACTN
MISRPVGRWVAAAVVVAVLGALALLGYRVLAPRDLLTAPTTDFPAASPKPDHRPFGSHRVMPLVVDGLRVHAEKRRVWAEGPVGERQETVPYWALRRWPAQVVGVAQAGDDPTALIISQWSDGKLIAIDLHKGTVVWRGDAPVGRDAYDGRRTGADTVYDPPALLVATAGDGRAAVVVSAPGAIHAYDARTGGRLYATDVAAGCRPEVWSSAGLLAVPPCGTDRELRFLDPRTGQVVSTWAAPAAPAPAACVLGRTECALVVAGPDVRAPRPDGTLRTVAVGLATAVTKADAPGAQRAGDLIVTSAAGVITAASLDTGEPRWSVPGAGTLVAANAAGVYTVTDGRAVVRLDPATGARTGVGCATGKYDKEWSVGRAYATDDGAFLAVERVTGKPATGGDNEYYWSLRPVVLAQFYPPNAVPQWEPRFGYCPTP